MRLFTLLLLPICVVAQIHIVHKEFHLQKPIKSWIEFKNENLARQGYDYSCGSASLATVLKYYFEKNISEKDVLDGVLSQKGINTTEKKALEEKQMALSFLDLGEFAKTKGFKAVGLAVDFETVKKLKMPVILYVKIRKSEHFTVYKGMDNEHVYLADPSFGNTKVKIAKFQEMFYQREDLQHPGKLLAILPLAESQKINKTFMQIPSRSDAVYETIKKSLLFH